MVDPKIPGIELKDIDVEGVDSVKGGTPFWFFQSASKMTEMTDTEVLDKIIGDKQTVMYELDVKVRAPEAVARAIAEQKARAWVRSRNPFTPSLVKVLRSRKKGGKWRKPGLDDNGTMYTVRLVIER